MSDNWGCLENSPFAYIPETLSGSFAAYYFVESLPFILHHSCPQNLCLNIQKAKLSPTMTSGQRAGSRKWALIGLRSFGVLHAGHSWVSSSTWLLGVSIRLVRCVHSGLSEVNTPRPDTHWPTWTVMVADNFWKWQNSAKKFSERNHREFICFILEVHLDRGHHER